MREVKMFQILKRVFSLNLEECGEGNVVNNRDFPKCKFKVFGNNNKIIISPKAKMNGKLYVYGNDNVVQIGENSFFKGEIKIGNPRSSFAGDAQKCNLKIGNSVYLSESCRIIIADDETKVSIGDSSAFARGTQILASDIHSLVDKKGKLLNKASFVRIGTHVWLCTDCKILKNSAVNDNCVVGAGSIINGCFWETNALIVGNPARIVRHNINWNKLSPNLYNQQQNG